MSIANFIARLCVQDVVYWASPTDDGYGGKTFDDPVEIKCRWEDVSEVISDRIGVGPGKEIVSKARVYVLQDVDEEGYLYLGTLDDLDSDQEANPESIDGIQIIKKFEKIPEIRGSDKFIRKAYL